MEASNAQANIVPPITPITEIPKPAPLPPPTTAEMAFLQWQHETHPLITNNLVSTMTVVLFLRKLKVKGKLFFKLI